MHALLAKSMELTVYEDVNGNGVQDEWKPDIESAPVVINDWNGDT